MHHQIARPQCADIYQPPPRVGSTVIFHLILTISGILCNVLLIAVFSGRAKLGTASFTYIRILAILQFVFFIMPFPLKLLTEHYQRGQTWIAANFIPLLMGFFHFAIASYLLCFAVRLQILVNYVTRSRRWNSIGWVAWRKICWILPLGVIANVSLCFEFNLEYEVCMLGNRTHAIGKARQSEALKDDIMKLEFIRSAPTIMYWITTAVTLGFLLSERCVLPNIGSPNVVKHLPLLANLRPLMLALLLSHSPGPIYHSYQLLRGRLADPALKLTLYGISYALPFPMMFLLSQTFRSHAFHIMTKHVFNFNRSSVRKDSTIRRVTQSIARSVAFSKLEMDNSEFEERILLTKSNSMRRMLKDDAIYRVRFAIPLPVASIREEEEFLEAPSTESADIESAEYLQKMSLDQSVSYLHTKRRQFAPYMV